MLHRHKLFGLAVLFCALALRAQNTFDSLSAAASSARESGDKAQAIAAYQDALKLRPDWEEGLWYLGTLQYDTDHYAEAITPLRRVIKIDPAMAPAWIFAGLCEYQTREYDQALVHLRHGVALGGAKDDPDLGRVANYHLAVLLIRNGEFEQATPLLASMVVGKPSPQVRTALGLALLRVPLLPNETDSSQDGRIQSAGDAAVLFLQNDPHALDSLRDLAAEFPTVPYIHYAYGLALASVGNQTQALAQQKQEAKLSPASPLPLIEISKLERAMHHALEAAIAEQKAKTLTKPHREQRIIALYSPHDTTKTVGASRPTATFEELSRSAANAANAGDTPTAIATYKQALAIRPDWYEGRWELARLQFASHQYADAIPTLKKCVEFKSDFGTAWALLGLAEYEQHDYANALIHLQRGQDLGFGGTPESVQLARYRLGVLLNRSGEFDRAADILGSVAESGPLVQQVQFAMGMSLLRVAAMPDEIPTSRHNLFQTAGLIDFKLQKSKYDDAFASFAILLRDYPNTPFLHYAAGTAHAALSEYDQAEAEYRKELPISPNSELPNVKLASLFLRQHRAADALPWAKKAIELKPDSAEARYFLGRSELETGDLANAIKDLELAEKMAPSSPEVHFNLAKAYAKGKQPEKAEEQRTIFSQLNAIIEQRRSSHGLQTYGGSRDMSDFNTTAPPPSPQ